MIPATLLYRDRSSAVPAADADENDLRLTPDDLTAATGWESKPQGLCRGEVCVPLPPERRAEFFDDAGRFNFTSFARYLGQPVVHDAPTRTWSIGESAGARRDALRSLDAPDFTLPDLDGTLHSLSQYRGKKVLLLSWASW
jgi:hypothetical protein